MPETIIILAILLLTLILAGRAQTKPGLRNTLFLVLSILNIGLVLAFGVVPMLGAGRMGVTPERAQLALMLATMFAGAAFLLMLQPVRRRLQPLFTPAFYPDSMPQMAALVFCVYLLANTVLDFVLSGGLSGIAEDFKGVSVGGLLLNLGIFVMFAVVGAGFPTRRNWSAVAQRLGLRWPTIIELAVGFLAAIGLMFVVFFIGIFWTVLTPKEVIDDQTQVSRLIAGSVNTLTFAFAVAMSAAVGEEIAFRGALQPIVGLWPTAIFFALTHIQYTLTPATLVIIVVGVTLGWVRKRYNTTAAILTHFTYDFALLFLTIYGSYVQDTLKAGALR